MHTCLPVFNTANVIKMLFCTRLKHLVWNSPSEIQSGRNIFCWKVIHFTLNDSFLRRNNDLFQRRVEVRLSRGSVSRPLLLEAVTDCHPLLMEAVTDSHPLLMEAVTDSHPLRQETVIDSHPLLQQACQILILYFWRLWQILILYF